MDDGVDGSQSLEVVDHDGDCSGVNVRFDFEEDDVFDELRVVSGGHVDWRAALERAVELNNGIEPRRVGNGEGFDPKCGALLSKATPLYRLLMHSLMIR